MNIDDDLLTELGKAKRTTEQLAELLDVPPDLVRGVLFRLREERRVYLTAGWHWVVSSSDVPRGRPRPNRTLELDERVYELLRSSPRTSTELCSLTGLDASRVYTSLTRLRRSGRVFLGGGRNPNRTWHTTGVDTHLE